MTEHKNAYPDLILVTLGAILLMVFFVAFGVWVGGDGY